MLYLLPIFTVFRLHQVNFGGPDFDEQVISSEDGSEFWVESVLGNSDISEGRTPAERKQKLIANTQQRLRQI